MKKIKIGVLFLMFFSLVSCNSNSDREAMDFYNKNIDNLSSISPDKIVTKDNRIYVVKRNNFPVYKVFVEICKNHKIIGKEDDSQKFIFDPDEFLYSISLDNDIKYTIKEDLGSKYDDLRIGFKCPVYVNE